MNDLTGRTFGRLLAKSRFRKNGRTFYNCLCSCGLEKIRGHSNLISGNTKSCGCLAKETTSKIRKTHGHTIGRTSRILECFRNMHRRCTDQKNVAFHNYGGRGIKVCERWGNFINFLSDMEPMPDGMTIERINTDGNYEPENCKWATPNEQSRNTRDNLYLTCLGVTKCITDWERYLKSSRCAIKYQIRKRGEEAAILYFLNKNNIHLDQV